MVYYFNENGEKKVFDYIEDLLDEVLDEDWAKEKLNAQLKPIKYGTAEYPAGEVLRKIDPIMFREYKLDLIWDIVENAAFSSESPEVNPEDGALIYPIEGLNGVKMYVLNEDEEMEDCE